MKLLKTIGRMVSFILFVSFNIPFLAIAYPMGMGVEAFMVWYEAGKTDIRKWANRL